MKNIGLKKGVVLLSDYDENWKSYFKTESDMILKQLGKFINRLEHVGSTSVEGLIAKPIIDMAGTLPSFENILEIAAVLEEFGYSYKGENGIENRHFFTKGDPTSFHLHLTSEGHPIFENHIKFRENLSSSPKAVAAYNALKRDLLLKYPNDRPAYTEGKHDFIQSILRGDF